jgi:RNA polymerase sigma-70 factor, ECF subfamily
MLNQIDNVNDTLLVKRIRQNDKDAFKSLYNLYSKRIYFFSLRYLSNSVEAEELVQTVFINVWVNRNSLDETISVKNYIYKAAVNYVYNYLKKKAIRTRFIESEINKGEIPSDITYEQVYFHDLERSINSIVETMPSQQQKIFQLSRYEGLTHKEIASKLNLSVRTVENQMYRSLKMIKSILKAGVILVLTLNSF